MDNEYEVWADSFRALSAKKLGLSVLELCADDDYSADKPRAAEDIDWRSGMERE